MSALSDLVDELLERDFESSPVLASSLGLTDYDSGMDDLSAAAFAQREADAVAFIAALRGTGRCASWTPTNASIATSPWPCCAGGSSTPSGKAGSATR